MYITKITFSWVTLAWITGVESSGSCNKSPFEIESETFIDKHLIGYTLGYAEADFSECAKECVFVTRCKSFSILYINFTCELHTIEKVGSSPKYDPGWGFFDINEWPKALFGECADKPCAANQRCVPTKPYSCLTEVYELACGSDGDCSDISGVCKDNKCVCPTNFRYSKFARKCVDYTYM